MSDPVFDPEPFHIDEPPALSDTEKLLSGLAYVSQILLPAVLPLVLLLTDEAKRSSFVRHHAVQALALLIVSVIYEMVAGVALLIAGSAIPCLLAILWVLFLLPLVPLLVYGWQAYQGRLVEIPWLSEFLRSNHWL